ncbi:MAG TPA: terminase gpA endonuclease subunit, partial [Chthoniobacter sp.]|nr:terminase gpA endonuclease subunit [Chthoniobacter sp.]
PSNEKLWVQYAQIRSDALKNDRGTGEATEFYRKHRIAMDLGTVVAWPQRHHPDELSAVQHAMNLRLDHGDAAFRAEYQNEPLVVSTGEGSLLTADEIAGKLSGIARGKLPAAAQYVTAFIDVHDNLLYYTVCGWATDFDGWLIDYGTYPDQHESYFTLRKATRTLQMLTPGAGREGAIRAGLDVLTQKLIAKEWHREDGTSLRMSKCLVDAGYVTDIVHDLCRHSVQAALLMPSRGVGIGAAGKPIAEYNRTIGDQIGFNWYITKPLDRNRGRHLRFDTNFWKSFLMARLRVALGDKGCLSLFGSEPEQHRLLADHFLAELPVQTFGQGRSVDEWKIKPDRPDNHLLDCVVGCTAAASLCGAVLYGTVQPPKPKVRMTMAEMQRRAREKREREGRRTTW